MISNERQYKISKAEARRFKRALAELEARRVAPVGVHPRLVQAERDALQSQLDELKDDIAEYETLKAGQVSVIAIDSFDELGGGSDQSPHRSGTKPEGTR